MPDADSPQQNASERVWLTAARPIEIAPGVLLPAGTYSGKSRRISGDGAGSVRLEYVLEVSSAALRRMGAEPLPAGVFLKEYNVTQFVTVGQMVVF